MGIEPFLIASAVDSVVSQRLTRRLCTRCKQEETYKIAYLKEIDFPIGDEDELVLFKAKQGGCPFCNSTGFRGRVGLYEVLAMDEELERLVVSVVTAHVLGNAAQEKGMKPLRQDGFEKVKIGVTSIEEVLRVVM